MLVSYDQFTCITFYIACEIQKISSRRNSIEHELTRQIFSNFYIPNCLPQNISDLNPSKTFPINIPVINM